MLVVAMLFACAAPPSPPPAASPEASPDSSPEEVRAQRDSDAPAVCAPPRPEVCTMVYRPVCATLAGEMSQTQYSSPCNACADDRVIAYREGTCE